jgi:hypothetical protein
MNAAELPPEDLGLPSKESGNFRPTENGSKRAGGAIGGARKMQ